MSSSVADYRSMVEEPWGKMFYELIFAQLDIPEDKRLKILDFGAGFCITAAHYAKHHDVVAVEPNEEMASMRLVNDEYTFIQKGIDYLKTIDDNSFDIVICHNVLEYADDKEAILEQLVRVLKPDGQLSVVKHNLYGRIMASAVFSDDPEMALKLLNYDGEESMLGKREVYSENWLTSTLKDKMELEDTYAIRTFFGLSSNNEIKYTEDWYKSMLELEMKTYNIDEYKKIAFFNHLIYKKHTLFN